MTSTGAECQDIVWDLTQANERPGQNKTKITQLWSRLVLSTVESLLLYFTDLKWMTLWVHLF